MVRYPPAAAGKVFAWPQANGARLRTGALIQTTLVVGVRVVV